MKSPARAADGPARSRILCILQFAFCVTCVVSTTACGARRIPLPSDPGSPLPDYSQIHADVTASCRGARTLTAELGLRGRAGSRRLSGRLVAGFERPASMRLEAVAPFGPPGFILATRGEQAMLLLPRDERVVRGESAEAILGALTGVTLAPADLLAILTGCIVPDAKAVGGRLHANGWASIDLEGGATMYLQRMGAWRVRAGRRERVGSGLSGMAGRVSANDSPALCHRASERGHDHDAGADRGQRRCGCRGVHGGRPGRCQPSEPRRVASGRTPGRETVSVARATEPGLATRSVTVRAHAKINLDLRVLGTRPDGFHELRTVFQAISLHDTIECVPREGPFAIECDDGRRAARPVESRLARGRVRCGARCGATVPVRDVLVRLHKRIPLQGGLGGGSADAAATLVGAGARVARPAASESAHRRGGHARRRRPVLPVRRHGARSWPRRRDLSAGRSAASLGRAARFPGLACRRSTRTAGTTPSATRRAARSSARPQHVPGPVAVARRADDQRPRGADRPASSRDRPDEGRAAPGGRAGGRDVGQRVDRVRPVSEAAGRRRWPSNGCPGRAGGSS